MKFSKLAWVMTSFTIFMALSFSMANHSAAVDSLIVNADGSVGIGTESPAGLLHLDRPDTSYVFKNQFIMLSTKDTSTWNKFPYISWYADGQRGMYLGYGVPGENITLGLQNGNSLHITGGKVGIEMSHPAYPLDVNGIIRGNNVSASDLRLKKDITPIENSLEKISLLNGVTFQWKKDKNGIGKQIGLIAQDVEKSFPEAVSKDNKGYKSVAYDKLVGPLVEAVKTLKAENESLKILVCQDHPEAAICQKQ